MSISSGSLLFFLAFIDFSQKKIIIGVSYFLVLVVLFLLILYKANKEISKKLNINGTNIKIIYGDIFSQTGIKVIAFNGFFDTQVDDRIISATALNGQYILHHFEYITLF